MEEFTPEEKVRIEVSEIHISREVKILDKIIDLFREKLGYMETIEYLEKKLQEVKTEYERRLMKYG
ncbi:MAG TPA: hypothetical protein VKC54_00205 [Patescibacteria group bacterium]|nr:hypothetical protein [Patescibacteria group bacterium]